MKNKEFTLSIFRNDPTFANTDKEDLRIRRTKTFLMQALIRLMEKQSFEQISVIDICNEALVHRATFYKHYKDKYDLLTNTLETLKVYIFADNASERAGRLHQKRDFKLHHTPCRSADLKPFQLVFKQKNSAALFGLRSFKLSQTA